MIDKVLINNKEYIYVKDYRDNEKLREGLNNLKNKPMDLILESGV